MEPDGGPFRAAVGFPVAAAVADSLLWQGRFFLGECRTYDDVQVELAVSS